jgi:hypothetical protein
MHFVQLHQVVVFAERDGPCDAGHHQSEDVGIPALEEQEGKEWTEVSRAKRCVSEDDVELEELLVRLGGQVVAVLSLQGRVPGHFPLQGFHQFGTAVRGEVAALSGQCLPGCDQDRHLYSGKSSGNSQHTQMKFGWEMVQREFRGLVTTQQFLDKLFLIFRTPTANEM